MVQVGRWTAVSRHVDELDEHAQHAARLALEGLPPLYGLDVDAARVALLLPLATALFRHGEQLARSTAPTTEPFFIGVPPARVQ